MGGDPRVVVAFTAGMLATVNPCALPMLPAYLGWFITGDDVRQPPARAVARAVVVAISVTVGFMIVFGLLGLAATAASAQVERYTPFLTPVVGASMAIMGVALVAGRTIKLPMPRLDRAGDGRGVLAMVFYGMSYAVVSVSCALPIFLAHVSLTFGQSWSTGLSQMGGFSAGFALVLVALSMSVALTRGSLPAMARRATAYVSRASGVLLALSGSYLIWYGYNEIRLGRGRRPTGDPLIGRVTGWSSDISAQVQNVGGLELGLVLGLFIAVLTLALVVRSGGRSSTPPKRRTPPAGAKPEAKAQA